MTSIPKILIVDDKKANLVALRQVLREVEAEIIEATSGNSALAATLEHDFAVAILDVMMPGMGGFELAEHLRGDENTRLLPIIFVTATNPDEQHVFSGYEAGCVDYIVKPFDPEILLAKVRVFLELNRQREELEQTKQDLEKAVANLNRKSEELLAANTRLHDLDRLKSMFIASMSHELRTPLNSVIGFSSILLNEWIGPLNAEQKESSSAILRSGKHLLSLINDVIDVSKIEAGKIDIVCDDFDLAELLTEVEQTFAKEAQDRQLFLTVQELHVPMHTDRRRLLQCCFNLVSNALKFTERGGVTVAVRHDETLGEVTITVTDTGIGIEVEDQSNLFKAFSRIQTPHSVKVAGTGLGLYLTQKIMVEILHGAISVTSSPGSGSSFSMTISTRLAGEGTGQQIPVATKVKS